jgi:hypothetical protein
MKTRSGSVACKERQKNERQKRGKNSFMVGVMLMRRTEAGKKINARWSIGNAHGSAVSGGACVDPF